MATIIHSAMTDSDGLHNPKGFAAAANPSYLSKSAAGALIWNPGAVVEVEQVGTFGYLGTPTATSVTTSYTYIAGTFTNPVLEGFTLVGAAFNGIVSSHADTHHMEIDFTASVESDTITTTVTVGVGLNSNTVAEAGSENMSLCKTAGETYALSGTCVVEVGLGDEITLLIKGDKSASVTVNSFQTTIRKFFTE